MDVVVEWLVDLVMLEHGVVVLQTVLLTMCLIAVAVPSVRWFQRRATFRDFAARHQLRFVGVLARDKRAPHTYFRTSPSKPTSATSVSRRAAR